VSNLLTVVALTGKLSIITVLVLLILLILLLLLVLVSPRVVCVYSNVGISRCQLSIISFVCNVFVEHV
jgi:hypothetical protein